VLFKARWASVTPGEAARAAQAVVGIRSASKCLEWLYFPGENNRRPAGGSACQRKAYRRLPRALLGYPPRRCRGIQKRDPTGRDGPYICSVVGALGEGHGSTGADHRSIGGSSCGGGMTDYLLRGVGGQIVWPSAFTASI
jgi:hypothetical protein